MSRTANKTIVRTGVGVLVVRDGLVLLGKRKSEHMPGFFAAPGGHLEYGESFADCAAREVAEETGLTVTEVELLTVGNYMLGGKHYVDVDMVVKSAHGEARVMEPEKVESWEWFSLDELPSPLFVVTARMIAAYRDSICADREAIYSVLEQTVI